MTVYFSKTTNSFFDSCINTQIPPDAIEITYEEYHNILLQLSQNMVLSSDGQGNPTVKNSVPQSIPLPILAQTALSKQDITVIRCYSSGIAVPSENQIYRNALRSIINGSDSISTSLPTEPPEPMGI